MRFGKIDNFILFGGGRMLCHLALKLQQEKFPVVVFSSQRHLTELVSGEIILEEFLKQNQIAYFASDNINEDKNINRYLNEGTLGISFGAAWIFNKNIISRFKGRLLNSHATRLPQDRGGGGFSWRILNGDQRGCSLIHQIDAGIDTGDIVKDKEYFFPILAKTPYDFIAFSLEQNFLFFNEFLEEIKNNFDFPLIKQEERASSYYPMLNTRANGLIDWRLTGKDIYLFINAFDDPYPGASTFIQHLTNENSQQGGAGLIGSKKVFLKDAQLLEPQTIYHPFTAGLIVRKNNQGIFIATVGNLLLVKKVIDESGQDILEQLQLGDRLYTPQAALDQAMTFRAVYDASGLVNKKGTI